MLECVVQSQPATSKRKRDVKEEAKRQGPRASPRVSKAKRPTQVSDQKEQQFQQLLQDIKDKKFSLAELETVPKTLSELGKFTYELVDASHSPRACRKKIGCTVCKKFKIIFKPDGRGMYTQDSIVKSHDAGQHAN